MYMYKENPMGVTKERYFVRDRLSFDVVNKNHKFALMFDIAPLFDF